MSSPGNTPFNEMNTIDVTNSFGSPILVGNNNANMSFSLGTPTLDYTPQLPFGSSPLMSSDFSLNTPMLSPQASPLMKHALPDKAPIPVSVDMMTQSHINPEFNENYLRELINHVFVCQQIHCAHPECDNTKYKLYHCTMCNINPSVNCEACTFIHHMIEAHTKVCNNPNCRIPSFESIKNLFAKSAIKERKYEQHMLCNVPPHVQTSQQILQQQQMQDPIKYSALMTPPQTINEVSTIAIKRQMENGSIIDGNETKKLKSGNISNGTIIDQIQPNNNNNNGINTTAGNNNTAGTTTWVETDMRRKKQTPKKTHSNPAVIPAHWIKCTICGKTRKIPNTLDPVRIPHFTCELNIWDPPYSNCNVGEEINKNNATIDLQGNYVEYEQEKEDFMEKLKQFHRDMGTGTVLRTPTLGRKEVDLYRLFREVTANGGSSSVVSKEGTWAKIYRGLENFSPTETSASFRLKKMYNKYLLPYEHHLFHFDDPRGSGSGSGMSGGNGGGGSGEGSKGKTRMMSGGSTMSGRMNIPYPLPPNNRLMNEQNYMKQNMKLPMINNAKIYGNNNNNNNSNKMINNLNSTSASSSLSSSNTSNTINSSLPNNNNNNVMVIEKYWVCEQCGFRNNENLKYCNHCQVSKSQMQHNQINKGIVSMMKQQQQQQQQILHHPNNNNNNSNSNIASVNTHTNINNNNNNQRQPSPPPPAPVQSLSINQSLSLNPSSSSTSSSAVSVSSGVIPSSSSSSSSSLPMTISSSNSIATNSLNNMATSSSTASVSTTQMKQNQQLKQQQNQIKPNSSVNQAIQKKNDLIPISINHPISNNKSQ